MDRNEAAAALDEVDRTERKLAGRAHWPFHRHAMFGLAEGLLVAAIAQPVVIAAGMVAAAMALLVVCVGDDRRRHGMFVTAWQPGPTRPLMIAFLVFLLAMFVASALARSGESAQPLGYLLGAITFAVGTATSLRWQKIYRAQLVGDGQR